MLVGLVLGAAITIGAAYVHDTMNLSSPLPGVARNIVNWDVATEATGNAARAARRYLDGLIGGIRS
jgi:hypothetical protein